MIDIATRFVQAGSSAELACSVLDQEYYFLVSAAARSTVGPSDVIADAAFLMSAPTSRLTDYP
ncbi:hypothetical protein ACVBGC_18335 [Burkholderia stagnalis]